MASGEGEGEERVVERDLPFTLQTRDAPGCRPSSAGDTLFHPSRVIAVGGSVPFITKEKLAAGQVKNLEWRVKWSILWAGPCPLCRYLKFLICKLGLIPHPRALVVME